MSGFIAESPNERRTVEQAGRVKDLPRPNFVFFYHPTEWQLNVAGDLVPSIGHFSRAVGAGADANGDFTPQRNRLLSRGFIEIPTNVLGAALPDYVAEYTNHRGKAVCRTVFQTPYNDGTGNTKWRTDDEAVTAFIAFLRRKGIVQRPKPEVVEGLLIRQEAILNRLADVRVADNGPAQRRHAAKVAAAERGVEVLRRELEESREVYGAPTAHARSAVLRLLQEDAADAESVVRKTQGSRRQPSKQKLTLPPLDDGDTGGFVAGTDEEDD